MKKLLLAIFSLAIFAITASAQTSGKCGDNLTYSLSADSVLTITGDGDMSYNPFTELRDMIKSVVINKGATSIGTSAFSYCSSLNSISIPSSVISIGSFAFEFCTALASINIPASVTSIGNNALYGCSKLESCNVDGENNSYSSSEGVLFNKDKTEIIKYPEHKSGNSYSIPESVTIIGNYAFSDCKLLSSITIPSGVTSIGMCAFNECSYLTTIAIPSNVTSIGDYAFYGCFSLASITIPSSVSSIGDGAFNDSYELTSIIVSDTNANYSSSDGVLFNKDKTEIIKYPEGKSGDSYSIPSSVTSIRDCAFYESTYLTSIDIPSGVTSIGDWAFYYSELLASITIPSSVTSIGYYAFENCTALERIISESTSPASCSEYTFQGLESSMPIYVPQASIETYKNTDGWNYFTNYQSIETSVDETAAEALVVTAENGTVSVNAEEFAILDLAGVDVTAENGSLSGVYLVKVGTEVVKVMVR